MSAHSISPDSISLCPLCGKPPGTKVGPPAMARCVTEGCEGKNLAAVTLAEWNAPAPAMTAPMTREELLEKAVRMFVAWDDGTHETSPAAWHDQAMAAAREALRGVAQTAGRATKPPEQIAYEVMSTHKLDTLQGGIAEAIERERVSAQTVPSAREALIAAKLTSPDGTFVTGSTNQIIAALSLVSVQAGQVADETAWLIELAGNSGVPSYHQLEHDNDWTPDASKALRFARRQDAQAYIHHIGWTEPRPVEHMWCAVTSTVRAHPEGCACDRCQGRPLKRSVSSKSLGEGK